MGTHAVVAPTSTVLERLGHLELEPYERERAAGFAREVDRASYVAAHLLVRACAGVALGVDPATVALAQTCPVCGGPHGRPVVLGHPDVHVSLAHSDGWVTAAAGAEPLAVDVEVLSAADGVWPTQLLTPSELRSIQSDATPGRRFLELWTRKECLVKLGVVELDDLGSWDVQQADVTAGALDVRFVPALGSPYGASYVACLAVTGDARHDLAGRLPEEWGTPPGR